MQLLRRTRSQNLDTLIKVFIVLGVLLIVLAVLALLGDVLGLLNRFRSEIFLFIIGAILAYLLTPLVHLLQRAVRKRWAAILGAYVLLFVALIVFAFLLLNPFISQARSLTSQLRNPAAGSLQSLQRVQKGLGRVQSELNQQQQLLANGQPLPAGTVRRARADIAALQQDAALLAGKPVSGQLSIPPSYVTPITTRLDRLAADYGKATSTPGAVRQNYLHSAISDAGQATSAALASYQKASSTPILLLNLQLWLDNHGIKADLHDQFGKALQQLNNQLASLLNNALGIALQAGTLLLNTVLTLIVSIYFISDGRRFVDWLIGIVPSGSRDEARFFVTRLDQILGSYLRTQVLIALLAASLDATGAVVLGVPYAVVIFFSSFFLSLVPVIGPVVLPFPPMLIAVIFTSLPTPIFYLVWLLAGEQLATNVVGPRLQGHSVGIHPLEAMGAALVGFPLAGFLGAFFAVPIVAFLHVVVRELVHTRRTGVQTRDAQTRESSRPAAADAATADAATTPGGK